MASRHILFRFCNNISTNMSVRLLSLSTTNGASNQNITVIGAGLMGAGIAQVSAQSGFQVTMVDQTDDILAKSKQNIEKSLARVARKKIPDDSKGQDAFLKEVSQRLHTSSSLKEAVSQADIVVEAVVENLELKQKLFPQIEDLIKPDAIMATNTSSFQLSDVAINMKKKEIFGGLHFFNPVPVMKLLEVKAVKLFALARFSLVSVFFVDIVVRFASTSDETFNKLMEFGKKLGKTPVACKDTPGFVVNRLLVPYMAEAIRMAERGDATTRDIDTAMKLGAGYPMGPFELGDYVGLDTMKFIIDGWHEKFPNEPTFKPNELLNKYVKEGKLGRKTGEGFYKY